METTWRFLRVLTDLEVCIRQTSSFSALPHSIQAHRQPSGNRGRLPQILDVFQGLKIGVPNGCLRETSIFKIIMIDDVTLWSKVESTW